jgi:BTB/POZ domain-containing protein 13
MLNNGNWKESTQTYINIEIPDDNVTEYSLNITFSSLYKDDITIIPNYVINVLATASLFNLDSLIHECESIMLDNISFKTILQYYYASQTYGLKTLQTKTFEWLCINIMLTNDSIQLNDLSLQLFLNIIESNKLMIIQVETDLYTLCKRWLYAQLQPNSIQAIANASASNKNWQKLANDYFISYIKDNNLKFLLDCPQMKKYECIFRKIRFNHILTDLSSLKLVTNDRIIPSNW